MDESFDLTWVETDSGEFADTIKTTAELNNNLEYGGVSLNLS